MMLFGMGMTLTKEEDEQLKDVVHSCYAALGLANDYFSFDREYREMQKSRGQSIANAVWLCIGWHDVDIPTAKSMVRDAATKHEKQFQELSEDFRLKHAPISDNLDTYLRGLAYQISGNVVWSLNCPRYHPEHRYDPNAGVEDTMTAEALARSDQPALVELAQTMSTSQILDPPAAPIHSRSSSIDSDTSLVESHRSSMADSRSTATSRSASPVDKLDSNQAEPRGNADLDMKVRA
jgi:hypothetical protein